MGSWGLPILLATFYARFPVVEEYSSLKHASIPYVEIKHSTFLIYLIPGAESQKSLLNTMLDLQLMTHVTLVRRWLVITCSGQLLCC